MADIKYYDVILKPVITEKSMNAMTNKEYTFLVHTEATKSQIKDEVRETAFRNSQITVLMKAPMMTQNKLKFS